MAEGRSPFTTMVSCKWLVVIGVLTIAISLVAGIILGVIAVHFSNATAKSASSTTDEFMSASAGAQHMDLTTTGLPDITSTLSIMSSTEKHNERDVATSEVVTQSIDPPTSTLSTSTTPKTEMEDPDTETTTTITATTTPPTTTVTVPAPTTTTVASPPTTTVPSTTSVTTPPTTTVTVPTTVKNTTPSPTATTTLSTTATTVINAQITTVASPITRITNTKDNATTDAVEFRDLVRSTTSSTSVGAVTSGMSSLANSKESETLPTSTTPLITTKPIQVEGLQTTGPSDVFSTRPVWLSNTNVPSVPTSTLPANFSSINATATTTSTTTMSTGTTTTTVTPSTERITSPVPITTFIPALPNTTSNATIPTMSTLPITSSASLVLDPTTIYSNGSNNASLEFSAWTNSTTMNPNSTTVITTTNPLIESTLVTTQSPTNNQTETPRASVPPTPLSGNETGNETSSSLVNSTTLPVNTSVKATSPSNNEEESGLDILPLENPTYPCPGSSNKTIFPEQMCDGRVDCPEASDETDCSCRSRMDPSKVCDGVFDCPSLDDETGCRGCNSTQFICDITRPRPLCIPLKQRCDGVEQCPDGMDEVGCTVLSPIQHPFEVSIPKYSSGYVMRNMKNKWYPLCGPGPNTNVTDLVSGICQLTVGDALGEIQWSKRMPNSKFYSGPYIGFTDIQNKPFMLVDNCEDLLFVQCPPPRCGRKAPSQSEVGRKVTTRSIATTMAATMTTKTPFIDTKEPITTGAFVNSTTPSTKPQSLLQSMLLNLQNAFKLSDSAPVSMEPAPLVRVRKSDSPRRSSRRNRYSGRFPDSLVRQRKRRGAVDRIVGGRESNYGAWPWIVAITRDGEFHCGGSLLNSSWILTAGHCFHSLEKYHYEIQLGMLRRSSYSPLEQTRVVSVVYVHQKYDPLTLDNDIALLQVQEPFDLNQWTAPACLPPSTYFPSNSTNCTVVGWGNVQESGPDSDALREVVVPIAPCKSDVHIDRKKILCAGYPDGKKDSCQGDSGGPLVCPDPNTTGRWILAGLVSFGNGCARPGELGAYTSVTYYLNWITEILGGNTTLPKRITKQDCVGMVCRRGTGVCLSPNLICDGQVDCLNAEDEVDCEVKKRLFPTTHVPAVTTNTPNLTTTALPTPVVCSENQFTCTKKFQCIDKLDKCDRFRDCSDGTDESSCSCADFLKGTGQSQLICDDHIDCWDHSDEAGCRNCSEGENYLFKSSRCIPKKQICDNQLQANNGDDETHCLAMVPQPISVALDRTGRPKREPSGLVAINRFGIWQPICVQNWSRSLSDDICSFSGYGPVLSYSLISGMKSAPLQTIDPPQGFLWNSFISGNQPVSNVTNSTPSRPSIVKRQAINSTEMCKFVNMTCGSQLCGIRPNLAGWDDSPNIEGRFPWQATLFLQGQYLCGATLVAPEWLLISANCSLNFNLAVDYVSALMGARRFTPFASPNEQIRRVANIVRISTTSKMVLLFLERPVELTEYVNTVCVAPMENVRTLIKRNQCAAVGMNGTLLASSSSFSSIKMITIRTLSVNWTNNETISCPSNKLSGSVVCTDGVAWHAVAIFERDCSEKGPFRDTLEGIWQHSEAINNIISCKTSSAVKSKRRRKRQLQLSCPVPTIPAPACASWRCPLGSCLQTGEVCDGVPDCRDRSDELNACKANDVVPFLNASKCAFDQYECSDGTCVPGNVLCDGVDDCSDGKDEKDPFVDLICPPNVFRCLASGQNRSQEMIPMSAVCDGPKNCSNGVDEKNCMAISAEFPIAVDANGNPKRIATSGFLVARVQGRWFPYCANDWSANLTSATCKFFGFDKQATFKTINLPAGKGNSEQQCSSVVFLNCA